MATPNTRVYPVLTGIVKLKGGTVLRGEQIVQDDLWYDSGLQAIVSDENQDCGILYDPKSEGVATIIDPKRRFWDASRAKDYSAHNVFDITGFLAVPGYIDIQTNGAFGLDYTSVPKIDETGQYYERTTLQNEDDVAAHREKIVLKQLTSNSSTAPKYIGKTAPTGISLSRTNSSHYNPNPNITNNTSFGSHAPSRSPSTMMPFQTPQQQQQHTGNNTFATPTSHTIPFNNTKPFAGAVDMMDTTEPNDEITDCPTSPSMSTRSKFSVVNSAILKLPNPEQHDNIYVNNEHLHPHKARTLINAFQNNTPSRSSNNNNNNPPALSNTRSYIDENTPLQAMTSPDSLSCSNNNDTSCDEFKGSNDISHSDLHSQRRDVCHLHDGDDEVVYRFNSKPFRKLLKMTGTEEDLATLRNILYHKDQDMLFVNEQLPKYGVTSLCPTIISSDEPTFKVTGQRVVEYMLAMEQARRFGLILRQSNMLGIHLEGPFISVPGAHNTKVLGAPINYEHTSKIYNGNMLFPFVSIVTLAPEMDGSTEVIRTLTGQGIIVSMGHSKATVEQAKAGIDAGASLVTHMFNAMRSFHHRDPGLIGVLGATAPYNIHFSIISDGYHAHPFSVNIAHNSSPEKLILVTDSMAAMGLPNGAYKLGTQDVTMENNKAVLTNSPANLAGAVLPLDQCVRNFIQFTNCKPEHAILAATKTPAELLGIYPRKGALLPGSDADIVILHPTTFEVAATIINGQLCYLNPIYFPSVITSNNNL